jgi:hypothetical protein
VSLLDQLIEGKVEFESTLLSEDTTTAKETLFSFQSRSRKLQLRTDPVKEGLERFPLRRCLHDAFCSRADQTVFLSLILKSIAGDSRLTQILHVVVQSVIASGEQLEALVDAGS